MQDCAAVFDRLPRRCTTPAQLPHIPLSHFTELVESLLAVLLHGHRPLGHVRRWRHHPLYRPLVDLSTMEERHVIITYRLDRATIRELLEPDLMSAIRHPTGIPPQAQVLSVLHFLASGSFQTTVAIASGISQPMFSNVLSRVLSALLKHMRSYIVFPQVEDLPTVKGDFYALGHIPNIIGANDGTHVALVPLAGVSGCTETGRVTIRLMCRWCVYLELSNVDVFCKCVCILSAAVCTANGILRLKDRRVDSWVVIVRAYSCWSDGGGFVIASLSLTFGVADLCGGLDFGRFRAVGHKDRGGIPRRCVAGLLHGGKRLLLPML
ncbi:hypothetical protein NDU88_005970 [Pleurodeles waltl]|uniref:Nuclease HARBI1 n=1 Tax=Pleurodeles waltl TaxID=8319 RepID=A0AAV7MKZ9_PLEWA|nr:hypothetical protein NDU88_005970 [Pleurodeles waltl]